MDHRLTPDMFERLDENDDALFYTLPRKLVHIDDGAIAAAGQCIAQTFAPGGVLLDSHEQLAYTPAQRICEAKMYRTRAQCR